LPESSSSDGDEAGTSQIESQEYTSYQASRIATASNSNNEERLLASEIAARQTRSGQAQQRLRRSVSRENRISVLEQQQQKAANAQGLTNAESAELAGLLTKRASFEEQYDPNSFTEEHKAFKASHNAAFVALARYCEQERKMNMATSASEGAMNLFFLDGPDGATSSALILGGGFEPTQCYSANRHLSTCDALCTSGGGILPPENVAHASAVEALTTAAALSMEENGVVENISTNTTISTNTNHHHHGVGAFGKVDFAGFYFDGCGSFAPHVVQMIEAALLRDDVIPSPPLVIGFSLVGGNRDVVDKEVVVVQNLSMLARRLGMRMVHVLDDPERYGVDPALRKIGGLGGGTMTTWLVLEAAAATTADDG
jgi:hypothetical protein